MASGISVEKTSLKSGSLVCQTCVRELESAAATLLKDYQSAGGDGWNDENYKKLGEIITNCRSSLLSPVEGINQIRSQIENMLQIVEESEHVF